MRDNFNQQNVPPDPLPPKNPVQQYVTVEDDPRNGNDAVCFTPGFPGATFGAGVIHAYLAADRKPPQVAAGISLGTVSAAVMQRCYADLKAAKESQPPVDPNMVEAARWKFFRKYLSVITDRPFHVIWNGIPDPADFFADLPPIKDPVPETIADESVQTQWKEQEHQARRELYLLVKLGHWLARLPIRISTVANLLVSHVRAKEKYASPKLIRILEAKLWQLATVISLVLHVVRVPARFPDYKFAQWRDEPLCATWRFHTDVALLWLRQGWRKKRTRFLYGGLNFLTVFVLGSIVGLGAVAKSPDRAWYAELIHIMIAFASIFAASAAALFWVPRIRRIPFWICPLGLTGLFFLLVETSHYSDWRIFQLIKSLTEFPHNHFLLTILGIFLLGLVHLIFLGVIARQKNTEATTLPTWWFHARTCGEWIIQKPLFGWPLYFASASILVLLLWCVASLSVSSFWYVGVSHRFALFLWIPTSVVVLFFTFSLTTWWIPMRGKFPFRRGPLVSSTLLVIAFTIVFQTNVLSNSNLDKITQGSASDQLTLNEGAPVQPADFHHPNRISFTQAWKWWQDSRWTRTPAAILNHSRVVTIGVVVIALLLMAFAVDDESRDSFLNYLFKHVEMNRHIVHDYHLNYALTSLFGENGVSPPLKDAPFPLLLVAAPLQSVGGKMENNQLWARTDPKSDEPKLVDVLRAALAASPVFDPFQVERDKIGAWYKPAAGPGDKNTELKDNISARNAVTSNSTGSHPTSQPQKTAAPTRLDLVDGAVIRQNPLPALFNFIRRNRGIVKPLEGTSVRDARVHVVYNVPGQASPAKTSPDAGPVPAQHGLSQDANKPATENVPKAKADHKLNDIVDVALMSLRLAKRRDIYLEIEQTNFIARLAREINKLAKEHPRDPELRKKAESSDIFPIFADHISPPRELSFQNLIAPKREEVLKHAAAGCKATLEQLYSIQIENNGGTVDCKQFLGAVRKTEAESFGIPEICEHCDRCLTCGAKSKDKAVFDRAEIDSWAEHTDFKKDFPQLSLGEPRIVFVASGGVFRGPFHVGMINAMLALNITPDLVVGASVGTLVGGALAATLAAKDRTDSLDVLGQLVDTFEHVDDRIAFTKSLKNGAREIGLRGRMIDLSPVELRRKIQEGTQSDTAFAVTGTPPVLIDAISDLLLIPHGDTREIAAEFVAGHFTDATVLLVQSLKKETLVRLGIDQAVMGASLLEPAARLLLGSMLKDSGGKQPWYDLSSRQPYQKEKVKIAIFATATDLCRQRSVLLGCYRDDLQSYDFINAALASSAFPAVFSPRKESEIFPGLGRVDNKYSDGGMFDNLPISPALEILAAAQKEQANADPVAALGKRLMSPDLFITGSLDLNDNGAETETPASLNEANANAARDSLQQPGRTNMPAAVAEAGEFDNLRAIIRRSHSLQHNLKIKAFEEVSGQISEYLQLLYDLIRDKYGNKPPSHLQPFLNGLVNAVLLPVYPADKDHLNGTFQFCNSLGRKPDVVNQSMADGCFQTLRELAISRSTHAKPARAKAISSFVDRGRIPELRPLPDQAIAKHQVYEKGKACPYFSIYQNNEHVLFKCPFSEATKSAHLYAVCKGDERHQSIYQKELIKLEPAVRTRAKGTGE